jgi:predicted RNA-binding protein with PIN domain
VTAVLIDARNVLRSEWPNIPEPELVELSCAWAAEQGLRAVVVFDGKAPGGLVGERELDAHCTLVGTGADTADDWLEREAARLAASGLEYWLVTSDRALREAAGRAAAQTIGGGTFARTLTS